MSCGRRKIFGQIEDSKARLFRIGYRITGSAFWVGQITNAAGTIVHQSAISKVVTAWLIGLGNILYGIRLADNIAVFQNFLNRPSGGLPSKGKNHVKGKRRKFRFQVQNRSGSQQVESFCAARAEMKIAVINDLSGLGKITGIKFFKPEYDDPKYFESFRGQVAFYCWSSGEYETISKWEKVFDRTELEKYLSADGTLRVRYQVADDMDVTDKNCTLPCLQITGKVVTPDA